MNDGLYDSVSKMENLFEAWTAVKAKGSAGGIDGMSIEKYDLALEENLRELSDDLSTGKFIPLPYKAVKIPKDNDEFRTIGLPAIRDKIVQEAVRDVLEPVLEKDFLDVSYGYRKNKGPVKAVMRVSHMLAEEKREWLTRCDIDRYFDTIPHDLLFLKLSEKLPDEERFLTLVRLFVRMGRVDRNMQWTDCTEGIPQGGIISPLLSNFYLHPLDAMMTGRQYGYLRYADDFIVLSRTEAEAERALKDITWFLEKRLKLVLNLEKEIKRADEGFEFLGIVFRGTERNIGDKKAGELRSRIESALNAAGNLSTQELREVTEGIERYYGRIIPQRALEALDEWMEECIKKKIVAASHKGILTRRVDVERLLEQVGFLSSHYRMTRNKVIKDICSYYTRERRRREAPDPAQKIERQDPVRKRKREFQKLESANFELVVTTPGVFIGKTKKGVSVRQKGVKVEDAPLTNLKHIYIMTKGVTLSSQLITWCSEEKIPIDFLGFNGMPIARLYPLYVDNVPAMLAQLQALADDRGKYLARTFVSGKIRNQMNLVKYYHKYRKHHDSGFTDTFTVNIGAMEKLVEEVREIQGEDMEDLRGKLFSIEGRAASRYWEIVETLLDEVVAFEGREREGATDLVNSLLNYGYGILYSKVWQAAMGAGLSPYLSFLHKPQPGKPTLIFDLIEEFRPHCVDRAVFSMINKGMEVRMDGERLSDETRRKVAVEVLERVDTVEVFRGREMRLVDIIKHQAKAVASFLTGEKKRYLPYAGKW